MLLSRHRDAEILSHIAGHLGFAFVRGSTNRGGVSALRQLLARSRDMHLTITPDGPRGPRRRLAPGCIYLASKLGLPLVVMGYGYERPGASAAPGTSSPFRARTAAPARSPAARSSSRRTSAATAWSTSAGKSRPF